MSDLFSGNYLPIDVVVNNRLMVMKDAPSNRETGVWHPSEIGDMCVRHKVIANLIPKHLTPQKVFANDSTKRMLLGDAIHEIYQEKIFGPQRVLWGKWQCSRCNKIITGFMPKTSCSCQRPFRKAEGITKDCLDVCENKEIRSDRGGCLHCGVWGKWIYREIGVRIPLANFQIVSGHIDGILKIEGKYYLLEIKSWDSIAFSKWLDEPKNYHVNQAMTYCHALNKYPRSVSCKLPKGWKGVAGIRLLYINRNSGALKEFVIDYDKKHFTRIAQKIKQVCAPRKDNASLPKFSEECYSASAKKAKDCELSHICFQCSTVADVKGYFDD